MRNEKGFTLIELLVVVAIIGILAAIAIPQFAAYRQRAFDARAESDLRNAMTAEEAYFVDNETYTAVTADLPGFQASAGVTLTINAADADSWDAESSHGQGLSCFTYDSTVDAGIQSAAGAC